MKQGDVLVRLYDARKNLPTKQPATKPIRASAIKPTSVALSAHVEVAEIWMKFYANFVARAVAAMLTVLVLSALLCRCTCEPKQNDETSTHGEFVSAVVTQQYATDNNKSTAESCITLPE